MKLIDSHAHIIPRSFIEKVRQGVYPTVSMKVLENGKEMISFNGNLHPCTPLFYDTAAQLAFLDEKGIDVQAISVTPRLFFYEWAEEEILPLCRMCNESILTLAKESGGRLIPVGGLPMQSVEGSLAEIEYLHQNGVQMIQIGTTVADWCLDEERFQPVYEKIAEYKMVLLLHPLIGSDAKTRRYHTGNTAGNPYQTTAAATNLIFSGMLDRVPTLKVLLVHGGGFLPYQIGRYDHAWRVRPAHEHPCKELPSFYLRRNFWSDGLTHDALALKYLIKVMGIERIMYGTDYPYDMADYAQVENLAAAGLPAEWAELLAERNFNAMLEQ